MLGNTEILLTATVGEDIVRNLSISGPFWIDTETESVTSKADLSKDEREFNISMANRGAIELEMAHKEESSQGYQ